MIQQEIINWEETVGNLSEPEPSTRHKYCGRKFSKIDPENPDERIEFTYICNDHRNCNWCSKEKAIQEREVLHNGLVNEKTNLIITECHIDDVKAFNRKLRDKDLSYRNYPQPNDKIIVCHCDETQTGKVIYPFKIGLRIFRLRSEYQGEVICKLKK